MPVASLCNSCSMIFPIRRILLPPKRAEITKVVRAGTNTMLMPLMIPGTLNGIRIFVITCKPFAPRSLAALITLSSILTRAFVNGQHHKGQEIVDHAQNNGRRRIDNREGWQAQE